MTCDLLTVSRDESAGTMIKQSMTNVGDKRSPLVQLLSSVMENYCDALHIQRGMERTSRTIQRNQCRFDGASQQIEIEKRFIFQLVATYISHYGSYVN
jgi:hypothetical protein